MDRRTALTRRTHLTTRTPLRRSARARRSSAGRGLEWEQARQRALTRDAYCCVRCSRGAVEVHHRRFCGMGGSSHPDRDNLSNLVSLCWSCHHEFVHGSTTRRLAERFGYIVRSWQDPAEVPLATPAGRFLLTDDGAFIRSAAAA